MVKKNVLVSGLLLFAIAFGFISCGNKKAEKAEAGELKGEISLSGAFALYPLAVKWAEEFRKIHPDVRIDVSAGGAGKGMTDALSKVIDLGMVSREIYPEEVSKGAIGFAVAKDAVVPTINAKNPLAAELLKKGLTQDAAKKLWITGEYTTWGKVLGTADASAVHVYTRSDACGAAETWAKWLGNKQEDLKGTAVFGDPGVASAVQKDPLGIGLNNLGYAYDDKTRKANAGLLVLPIDVNGNGKIDPEESFYTTKDEFIKAVADDKYPSPPARDLYLVANGTPTKPEVIAFLKYILTEGQKENLPAGYIGIAKEKLDKGLARLNSSK